MAAKKKPDMNRLMPLADEIASWPLGRLMELAEQLKGREGLVLKETRKGSGMWTAQMAGLKSRPVADPAVALVNWSNLARRTARRGPEPVDGS